MWQFRIFLASPGDVHPERGIAREVIEKIRHEPRFNHLDIKVVAWDQPGAGVAMEAGLTPQEAIKRGLQQPKDCDLVVMILWARIGTPLPSDYRKADGSRYRSGTEWEFLNALEGFREQGSPSVWLYRRTEAFLVPVDDPDYDSKGEQWKRLQDLLKSLSNEDGSIEGGVNPYCSLDDFRRTFEEHLRTKLERTMQGSPQTSNTGARVGRYEDVKLLLEQFFQPISNRLKKDTAIWEGIKRDKRSRKSIEYKMAFALEMNQIIPNHKEIVSIIEKWRHLVDEDKELSEVLDQYLQHVSTFIAIRDAGEDWEYPELRGYPWPAKLIPVIEARLEDLRKERKRLEYQAS